MDDLQTSSVVPENDLPEAGASTASAGLVPADDLPSIPGATQEKPDHVPEFGEDFGESLSAGIKGFGRAITGGQSDKLAQQEPIYPWQLPAEKKEDIIAQEKNSPIASGVGELAGSAALLAGTEGLLEPSLGINAAIKGLPALGKIGANAAKFAIESGLLQGSSEVGKYMLGEGDPEAPVASALAHMGSAALLGGLTGGIFGTAGAGLARIGESKVGQKMGKLAQDFGSELRFIRENPEPVETMRDEINNFHNSTLQGGEHAWDLKDSAIKKLVPEMGQPIVEQNQQISKQLQDQIDTMVKNPDSYPPSATKKFQSDFNKWMEVSTDPSATSHDVFNATQDLKRKMQFYSKYGRDIHPLSDLGATVDDARNISTALKNSLENTNVWGDAAKLQKGINSAYSELTRTKGPLSSFSGKFMTNNGESVVADPQKINTFLNQLGTNKVGVKTDVLNNYMGAMNKYRDAITDLHGSLGLESPFEPATMNITEKALGKVTNGAKLAKLFTRTAPDYVGKLVAEGGGGLTGGLGGFLAGREIAPLLSDSIGRPISNAGANALIKVIESQSYRSAAEALSHADNVQRGANKISSSLEALFKSGGQKVYDSNISEKDRDKLKKYIDKGGEIQKIQNQLDANRSKPGSGPQGFAEGGIVNNPSPIDADVHDQEGGLGSVYPAHNMLMQAAKYRISNYLNSMKPQENPNALPFDEKPDQTMQHKSYDKAIDTAIQPLGILNKVKHGVLTQEDMKHFGSMYPELHDHLSKEITKKILDNKMNGEKPSYNTRQGLSMFLGAPMDSTFQPQNIQAAQNVFAQQKAANQATGAQKTKKNTSKMDDISKQHQTSSQASESRQLAKG